MRLIASLIVRDELNRYLIPCIEHLRRFCDEIRVLDDSSTDGSREWLEAQSRVHVLPHKGKQMFEHEGKARNALLGWTLKGSPTHVLAVDADEFITDGIALRAACHADEGPGVWSLAMEEVWKADEDALWLRQDGAWRAHQVPILWRVPKRMVGAWMIDDRQLACGREPMAVRKLYGRAVRTGVSVLHLGWTSEQERRARYNRYVVADNGRFHAGAHLRSILAPDRRVRLGRRDWPEALGPWKVRLVERANVKAAA